MARKRPGESLRDFYDPTGKDAPKKPHPNQDFSDRLDHEVMAMKADKRRPHEDPMMHKEMYSEGPLTKARSHLDKETERGDHSPKVGGHGTEQHGGRIAIGGNPADAASYAVREHMRKGLPD